MVSLIPTTNLDISTNLERIAMVIYMPTITTINKDYKVKDRNSIVDIVLNMVVEIVSIISTIYFIATNLDKMVRVRPPMAIKLVFTTQSITYH